MSEWQPIETAPKDGTRFLAAEEWDIREGWLFVVAKVRNGKFVVAWDNCDEIDPTHWMPLPAPPVVEGEE